MMIVNSISSLYSADNRTGDGLLKPQRWCHHQWSQVCEPFNTDRNQFIDIVERVIKAVLLILPTLASYAVGLVGVVIKGCSAAPQAEPEQIDVESELGLEELAHNTEPEQIDVESQHDQQESAHNTEPEQIDVESQQDQQEAAHNTEPEQIDVESQQDPEKNTQGAFKSVCHDVIIHMATYLTDKDKLNLRIASSYFKEEMGSPVLWKDRLLDNGIWGAASISFQYDKKKSGYHYKIEKMSWNNPVEQLCAYVKLSRKEGLGVDLKYIARLMPGGPVAFDQLPNLKIDDVSKLEPKDMPSSLVRGTDNQGVNFFALRVVDTSIADQTPVVLLFVQNRNHKWKQVKNPYWTQDQIRLYCNKDLNYILDIVKKEKPSDDNNFVGFRKDIKLV